MTTVFRLIKQAPLGPTVLPINDFFFLLELNDCSSRGSNRRPIIIIIYCCCNSRVWKPVTNLTDDDDANDYYRSFTSSIFHITWSFIMMILSYTFDTNILVGDNILWTRGLWRKKNDSMLLWLNTAIRSSDNIVNWKKLVRFKCSKRSYQLWQVFAYSS